MSGVWNDLDALESFMTALKTFSDDFGGMVQALQGKWGELGEYWRDQEHERFADRWDEAVAVMQRFLDQAPDYIDHLESKAGPLRAYLGR